MPEQYTFSSLFGDFPKFDPSDDELDIAFVDRFGPIIELLSLYFRPTYHGLDNIPHKGAALLVGNHGILGFDGFFIILAIYRATGRFPRGLGDYHLFVDPLSRAFWTKVGAIAGTQEHALKYLNAGNLVNVYPGGARDAMKGPDGLYRLHWEKSKGFIRLAMKAQVPIILHMGIGTDDTYHILGKLPLTGRIMGHRKYEIPILMGWGPFPRPVKFDYYISKPIDLEGGLAQADDPAVVDRNHEMVWELARQMINDGLSRRESIWYG